MKSLLSKYSFVCYALISVGQLWLYSLNLRSEGLYDNVTNTTNEWIGSHLILFIGTLLIIPLAFVLKKLLKDANRFLVNTAVLLTILGAISLLGQFIIDFYLVDLFKNLSSEAAYARLDLIRSKSLIQFLFYDLVGVWVIGQICFIIALSKKGRLPIWAIGLYILAILMLILGNSIHELLERTSYFLITIALLPLFIPEES